MPCWKPGHCRPYRGCRRRHAAGTAAVRRPGSIATPGWAHSRIVALFGSGRRRTGASGCCQSRRRAGCRSRPASRSMPSPSRTGSSSPSRSSTPSGFPSACGSCRPGTRRRIRRDQPGPSTRAWPSAPAPTPPPAFAWNGWNRPSRRTAPCSTTAAARHPGHRRGRLGAGRVAGSTSTPRPSRPPAPMPNGMGSPGDLQADSAAPVAGV